MALSLCCCEGRGRGICENLRSQLSLIHARVAGQCRALSLSSLLEHCELVAAGQCAAEIGTVTSKQLRASERMVIESSEHECNACVDSCQLLRDSRATGVGAHSAHIEWLRSRTDHPSHLATTQQPSTPHSLALPRNWISAAHTESHLTRIIHRTSAMSRAASLLSLLRDSNNSANIRSDMMLRVMQQLVQQAHSDAADGGGRAELLQLDAAAVAMHVMRVYREEEEEERIEEECRDGAPRFLQVHLACLSLLAALSSDATSRATFLPRLANELISCMRTSLDAYAHTGDSAAAATTVTAAASTAVAATLADGAQPAASTRATRIRRPSLSTEIVCACMLLANTMLSEGGGGGGGGSSATLYAEHEAFFQDLVSAMQEAVLSSSGGGSSSSSAIAMAPDVKQSLHSGALTLLLLLVQHDADRQELRRSADVLAFAGLCSPAPTTADADAGAGAGAGAAASNPPPPLLLSSRSLLVDAIVDVIGPTLVVAIDEEKEDDDDAPYLRSMRWKYCALFARYCQTRQRQDNEGGLAAPSPAAVAAAAATPYSSSSSSDASDPLSDRAALARLVTSIVSLLAGVRDLHATPAAGSSAATVAATAVVAGGASWETQALTTLRELCARYPAAREEGLASSATSCHAVLHVMRARPAQPELLQAALRLMHSLLLQPSTPPHAATSGLDSEMDRLAFLPVAAAASSSTTAAAAVASASSSSVFPSLLCRSGALSLLLTMLERSLCACPLTHVEASAWADVHTMSLYAFTGILMLARRTGGADATDASSENKEQQNTLEAVDRAWPLILRSMRALAQEEVEKESEGSNGAAASLAPSSSSSSLQALSGALYVLAGRAAWADRMLALEGGIVVSATLECAAACGLARGGELARTCLVFLLRLGAHAHAHTCSPSGSAVFLAHAPRAELLLQPLFDSVSSTSSPLADALADALLMLQGKAPPPAQYRA